MLYDYVFKWKNRQTCELHPSVLVDLSDQTHADKDGWKCRRQLGWVSIQVVVLYNESIIVEQKERARETVADAVDNQDKENKKRIIDRGQLVFATCSTFGLSGVAARPS